MSKFSKFFLVLLLSGSVSTCYASACETLICMAGKAGAGSSDGSSCDGPIKDFFNILKLGHHGSFKAAATADARKAFLMSCEGASENKAIVDTIITKFGKVRL